MNSNKTIASKPAKIIKPGLFSIGVAADSRRCEFDICNQALMTNQIPIDFLFMGDSITHMWELQAFFAGNAKVMINRGIGGDTTQYALKRFEADVIQLKPKTIVLLIGVNDTWMLGGTNNDLSTAISVEQIVEMAAENMRNMVERCVRANQQLVICSVLPVCYVPGRLQTEERNDAILKINKRYKKLAEEYACIYADYHTHFVKEDGLTLRDELSDDGLHPHVIGYNIMADVLGQSLKEKGIEL